MKHYRRNKIWMKLDLQAYEFSCFDSHSMTLNYKSSSVISETQYCKVGYFPGQCKTFSSDSSRNHVGADGFIFVKIFFFFWRFHFNFNYQYVVAFGIFTIKFFIHSWQSAVQWTPSGDYLSFSIRLTNTESKLAVLPP